MELGQRLSSALAYTQPRRPAWRWRAGSRFVSTPGRETVGGRMGEFIEARPMSLEAEMEAAVAAQKARSEKLKQGVKELEEVGRQGAAAGRRVQRMAIAGVTAVAMVLMAVLWTDPRSRSLSMVLAPCLLLMGLWSYHRRR